MLTLHAVWDSQSRSLQIWGEGEPRRSARRSVARSSTPIRHPFAAPPAECAALLGLTHEPLPNAIVTTILTLPSHERGPAPSPELTRVCGKTPGIEGAVELREWVVPVVSCGAGRAALCLITGGAVRGGAAEGDALRFWREAAWFLFDLLGRERFLPELHRDPGTAEFSARWLPALNLPADAARFRALAAAMPPSARCATMDEDGKGLAPAAALRAFLRAGTDELIRTWAESLSGEAEGSAGDAWLAALSGIDARPKARVEVLRPLLASVQTWQAPILGSAASGFRTCFRLDPPVDPVLGEAPESAWALSFWLQAVDETSLLVPAATIWEGEVPPALGNRAWSNPREVLLPALARAGRLFPPVATALAESTPCGCALTTAEAYQFLREAAPLLEETGSGVLTPDWWRRGRVRLGVRATVRPARSAARGILTQDRLVEFDWQVALGDEPLSAAEFAALRDLKSPLVRIRGKWVEVDPNEIEHAIRSWERRRVGGPLSLLDALRLATDNEGLPLVEIEAEGELAGLLGALPADAALLPIPVPDTFQGTLRPYQQYGLQWLTFLRHWGLNGCLADDMGLGKTIQVLCHLLQVRSAGEHPPALLVCPTSLVENWRREAEKFAPSLRVYVHHGAGRIRERPSTPLPIADAEDALPADDDPSTPVPEAGEGAFSAAVAGMDLVVTTYPLALRDAEMLAKVSWDTLILDEAQNIKNPEARQTRAIRGLPAGSRLAMTGTPVENRLTDLWSLMEFLNPGFLGSQRAFRREYATPIEREQDAEASARLRTLTRPFLLRRVKTDPTVIQDLPPKLEMEVVCTLTPEQATLYAAVTEELLAAAESAEGIQRRGLILSSLARLKQICNHPAHFLQDSSALPGRSGKLQRLQEMLEEILSVGEAALVVTQFAEMGTLLQGHLSGTLGCEVLFLHGGVPRARRVTLVERFQAADGPPVMLLSLKAGGVGLNLTRANHVFHYDRWWNPAVENQATDRAFRIGQQRQVQVHKFVCAGTLEEHIAKLIEQKKVLAENIVGTGEGWLTELTTAQLRDLVTLRR